MSLAGLNWIEYVPEAGCLKENKKQIESCSIQNAKNMKYSQR
jgi:hypothetical protein